MSNFQSIPEAFLGSTHAFLVDDFTQSDIVIHGYLRRFDGVNIPLEIMGIIGGYYATKYVHLFRRATGAHWKIPLNEIIGNA